MLLAFNRTCDRKCREKWKNVVLHQMGLLFALMLLFLQRKSLAKISFWHSYFLSNKNSILTFNYFMFCYSKQKEDEEKKRKRNLLKIEINLIQHLFSVRVNYANFFCFVLQYIECFPCEYDAYKWVCSYM